MLPLWYVGRSSEEHAALEQRRRDEVAKLQSSRPDLQCPKPTKGQQAGGTGKGKAARSYGLAGAEEDKEESWLEELRVLQVRAGLCLTCTGRQ